MKNITKTYKVEVSTETMERKFSIHTSYSSLLAYLVKKYPHTAKVKIT